MTSKITFSFIKEPDSNLHFLGGLHSTTPIDVDSSGISLAVFEVFKSLNEKDASTYNKTIQSLILSDFSVTFVHPNQGQNSLKIESDTAVIDLKELSEQTAALFLNSIHPPQTQKSAVEWVIDTLTYLVSRLVEALTYVFTPDRHFTKEAKYHLIQEQLGQFASDKNIQSLDDSPVDHEIRTAWNALVEALLEPTHFKTPDEQYRKTVECLRKTRQLLSDASSQEKFAKQLQFVRELSYMRFAGIELFPYCHQLIEYACGEPLPPNLTLSSFQEVLTHRSTLLEHPAESTTMNPFACQANKARGTFNIDFDPLLKTSNIPYRDGQITVNDRSTLMLWHGTPVEQHDPYGSMFDLAAGALSYIPYVGGWIEESNPLSTPPVINDDYIAFIEEAAEKNQKILHVILENGQKKRLGDESNRVKARVNLAVDHENFFPIALRLDGKFFERHDEAKDQTESIQNLKTRLKDQLLMPLGDVTETEQMENQLAANGFCIPQKLRDACALDNHIDSLLDEVQQIYFPGKENIVTQEEHQAFLVLSYVHIILFICWKMDISILEALCKDDKDRGNVIKTVLKLHFLYITGQINQDNLTAVLTHALARPFILQKGPIIDSRLVLLERVIPFISTAHNNVPAPDTLVFGKPVETASYVVDKPQGQTIYPYSTH